MKSDRMNKLTDLFIQYNIKNPDRINSIRYHHKILKLAKQELLLFIMGLQMDDGLDNIDAIMHEAGIKKNETR